MRAWPHQQYAVDAVCEAIADGEQRICVTSPTGGGKSRVACDLIALWGKLGHKVVLYTNRRLLIEQLSGVLDKHGLPHGVRAAGHQDQRELPLQISSIPTEVSRVLKREESKDPRAWQLHPAGRVLIDEAHLQAGDGAQEIIRRHVAAGAAVVGLTATPIDLAHVYDVLIVAGTNSELRACGALVPAKHYGPDEPDLKHIKKVRLGEDLSESQNVAAIMVPGIFGRVFEWYHRLNPGGEPTLLFAPGVPESLWFAEQFHANGISAAHIDGEEIWLNGETMPSDRDARARVLAESREGRVQVICNRFVLREGIDMPWVTHGILATVFGSLQSYLQSGGRLLRASTATGKTHATVQDHGGNWHRHGSLNADRAWDLGLTGAMIAGIREEKLRKKEDPEPMRCPQCAQVLVGTVCPCGYELDRRRKSRPVVMHDGSLQERTGDIYFERKVETREDTEKLWKQMYHRAYRSRNGMTFGQAYGLFFYENAYWPPKTLPLMPRVVAHWFMKVNEVPKEMLL